MAHNGRREDPTMKAVLGDNYRLTRDLTDHIRERANKLVFEASAVALTAVGQNEVALPLILGGMLGTVDCMEGYFYVLFKDAVKIPITHKEARTLAILVTQRQLAAELAHNNKAGQEEFKAALKEHGLDHLPIETVGF